MVVVFLIFKGSVAHDEEGVMRVKEMLRRLENQVAKLGHDFMLN